MTHTVACVVIATERRRDLVRDRVMPSVVVQTFDEVVLVGDWPDSALYYGARYFCVAPLTRTTTDALVKRDVGTLATTADTLVYLCDDHALAPNFLAGLRAVLDEPWDVLVPNRYTSGRGLGLDDFGNINQANSHTFHHPVPSHIPLNNGERAGYCGGHGGVFRRSVIAQRPWSAHQHHRLWDAMSSAEMQRDGARFVWKPRADIAIIDLEPSAKPWE